MCGFGCPYCCCWSMHLLSYSSGSAEGFSQADKAINSAIKTGRWVMLKNVHLAPSWLIQLEKKLHRSASSPSPLNWLAVLLLVSVPLPVYLAVVPLEGWLSFLVGSCPSWRVFIPPEGWLSLLKDGCISLFWFNFSHGFSYSAFCLLVFHTHWIVVREIWHSLFLNFSATVLLLR